MASNPQPPGGARYESRARENDHAYETRVHISNLPREFDTQDLWDLFHQEGEINNITIFRKDDGTASGEASMYFGQVWSCFTTCLLTPPSNITAELRMRQSWLAIVPRLENRTIELRLQAEASRVKTCVNPSNNRKYATRTLIHGHTLTFGVRRGPCSAQSMITTSAIEHIPIVLAQNSEQREVTITFPLHVAERCVNHFKIRLSYTSSLSVWELLSAANSSQRSLVFSTDTVPEFFVKRDESKSHTSGSRTWNKNHTWLRKTDIPNGANPQARGPTALRKQNARIDIGFWRVYCVTFDLLHPRSKTNYSQFCKTLEDFNVKIHRRSSFELSSGDVESIWTIIDAENASKERASPASVLAELNDFSTIHLPFRTRYQLEACISDGTLGEFDIPRSFVQQLRDLGPEKAVDILEDVSNKSKRIYNPSDLLDQNLRQIPSRLRKLPNSDFTYVYSAVVTPTTIHYNAPMVEISNRVLRRYPQHHDRFLRVKFEEERPRGKLYPGLIDEKGGSMMDEVFERIKSTLENGVVIGDRHYDFLGFGSSQFRENGAYFFASLPHLSVKEIRASMGSFRHIRSVSKYAARLGQCFSTTRPVRGARALVSETPDIWTKDGKYIFTDGVGIISRCMAQLAASEMGMALPNGEPPSVLQFRSGGAKGVLAIHHDPSNTAENRKLKIWIRQSQSKFHADYELLEVVRWSQFSAAHLNRQLIIVLSDLGVSDDVFISLMAQQLKDLDAAMCEPKVATRLLQKEVDQNQMTLVIASLIKDGFFATNEPFLLSLLHLWRAWCIKHLKDKAKIPIGQGAVLLGCVDEFAVLQGHYNHKQRNHSSASEKEIYEATPEVFVQLSNGPSGEAEVITGYMILTRSPSLHPGDIRVVRGVDRSELHHLRDVVVLPQTGDRDIGNMCSGGDLDGDDYLVIWDQNLLPRHWNQSPMDYSALAELLLDREVAMKDIIEFFITYMKNDSIGTIANSHLATADREVNGVQSTRCLKLAELHSRAVDYAKSGHAAKMSPDLQPQKWPHFMNRSKGKTYRSTKILGQLYDLVDRADFSPCYGNTFDSRILGKLTVSCDMLNEAGSIKSKYDIALRRIMMQYDVRTEFEVWSTFALQHIKRGSDYKMSEVLGEHAAALKESFRAACREAAGGRDFSRIGPFVYAMYEVTWREAKAHADSAQDEPLDETVREPPFISFPWIFHQELGKLANLEAADLHSLGCGMSQRQHVCSTAVLNERDTNKDSSAEDPEMPRSQERLSTTHSDGAIDTTGKESASVASSRGDTAKDEKVEEKEIGINDYSTRALIVPSVSGDDFQVASLLEQLAFQ